jgi:hypothetical protein
MGTDVNAGIGQLKDHIEDYKHVIGCHGLPKCNAKGKILLNMYLALNLQVMNTSFYLSKADGPGYGMYANIGANKYGQKATELDIHARSDCMLVNKHAQANAESSCSYRRG